MYEETGVNAAIAIIKKEGEFLKMNDIYPYATPEVHLVQMEPASSDEERYIETNL